MADLRTEVFQATQALKKGGVILYPSDTIWGLGCDPNNAAAIEKLFAIKGRSADKAIITLVSDAGQLNQYVNEVPEVAWDIVEFADRPLTVIYPGGKSVAPQILGADKSIAIRVVKEGFCHRLVHAFGRGLTSTSANKSGEPSPRSFADIPQEIKDACDYVVDSSMASEAEVAPSKIIRLDVNGGFKLIRG